MECCYCQTGELHAINTPYFSRVVKLFDSYACQSPLLTHRLTLIQKLVTDF